MSKIILSYSNYHFNSVSKQWIDGAGFLSFNLYESLCEVFDQDEVIFTDHKESRKFRGITDIKLLIGISSNLNDFAKITKPEKTVLWAVNKSVQDRLAIRKKAKGHNLPTRSLTQGDGIYGNVREIQHADLVLGIGGWSNYQSFLRSGMNSNSVYMIGASSMGNDEFHDYSGGVNILFFCGSLSFRKGAHLIPPILNLLKSTGTTKLIVVGRPSAKYWQEQMDSLKLQFPLHLEYISERLDFNSKAWRSIIESCQFAIFPSFEEGIAGTSIDVIAAGLPLLISNEVGLEFTEKSPILTMKSNDEWLNAISEMLNRSFFDKKELLIEQQKLVTSGGKDMPQLKKVLRRVSQENFWPQTEFNSNIDFSLNKHNFGNNEFMVSGASENKNSSIDLQKLGSLSMSNEDYVRLGIMTLDKLINIKNINVYNESNEIVSSISRCGRVVGIKSRNNNDFDKAIKILYIHPEKIPRNHLPINLRALNNFFYMKLIHRFAIREKSIFRKFIDVINK